MTDPTWHPAPDADIVAVLDHPDRSQLLYQIVEIIAERSYLRHGLTVPPGSVVLDVGANVGVSAAFFAMHCGATVHSFEAVAPVFEILTRVTERVPGCTAHHVAVGRFDGQTEVTWYPGADAISSLYADPETDRAFIRTCLQNTGMDDDDVEQRVADLDDPITMPCEIRRLSTLLRSLDVDRVSLLKIDVERAELDVLVGVDEDDWSRIDQVVAEVHAEGDRLEVVRELLERHGFVVTVEQDRTMSGTDVVLVYAIRAP